MFFINTTNLISNATKVTSKGDESFMVNCQIIYSAEKLISFDSIIVLKRRGNLARGYNFFFMLISAQLSMKSFLLINVTMPTVVGIFNIYEQEK